MVLRHSLLAGFTFALCFSGVNFALRICLPCVVRLCLTKVGLCARIEVSSEKGWVSDDYIVTKGGEKCTKVRDGNEEKARNIWSKN